MSKTLAWVSEGINYKFLLTSCFVLPKKTKLEQEEFLKMILHNSFRYKNERSEERKAQWFVPNNQSQ